jgi:hypothetical protein
MLVICPEHGTQLCVQMSSDLVHAMMRSKKQYVPIVRIQFHCEGEQWACYVSPQFAKQHGITVADAPIEFDDQPWLASLSGFCAKCFGERMQSSYEG